MKNTFLSRFTPSMMTPETLEAILVQRHELADYLVELIRESALTANKHFRLLVGMRGIGKTHMIALVYHRVSKMEDLQDKLLIAWLREEEWGVTSFLDLLLRIFRAFEKEYPAEYNTKLNQQIEALYQLSQEEAEFQAAVLLREFVGKRTLLLLMENLDDLFDGLRDIGQKQLRAYIQNYSFITILATAQSLFDGVRRQDDPFYGFFYPHSLKELTLDEAVDLLRHIARLEGDRELESFIKSSTGRDRIKAIHHLAGGNHRIYVILSQFLTRKSLDELVEPFMQMLDDLTPYYQARMAWLSQQQRKIIEFLSNRRHAITVKEIAQRCFITHQTASSQLKDLREKCYVTSQAIGRESFYELQEPLMRFCMEVKKQRGEPIRLFVDFLRLWYTRQELQQRLGWDFHAIGNDGVFDDLQRPLSVALMNNLSQKENHFKPRLETLPTDANLEQKYILYALKAMEEDEEDPRIAAYWQEYEDCRKKKDYHNALQHAEKLVEIRGHAQDLSAQAFCLNKLKCYEEAFASSEKAIHLEPNYAMAWIWRGEALFYLKCYEEALASHDKVIELYPNYLQGWGGRGDVLNKLERYEEALASYDKAIELASNYDWVWANRGDVLKKLERYEEALASYDKAIELDANYEWAWGMRGDVLEKLERYEEALASYDKAIELGPNYAWAWVNRGWYLNRLQRYEEALASLDKAIEFAPNYNWPWSMRGDVLKKLERYEEALVSYDKAIELDPNHAWTWEKRGDVLQELERYEETLASYDKAIELDPNHAWAWQKRGDVLQELERYEETLASYDKAIELDPDYAWTWEKRGDVLQELERYEEALASYDKAIELDSNHEAWGDRGWVLIKLGRYDEALASCDRTIALGEQGVYIFFNRAISLLALNRWEKGITTLYEALNRLANQEEAEAEDTELIIRNLFNSTNNVWLWKTRITTLIQVYDQHQVASALAQGLVRRESINALMSEMVSDKVARTWLEIWQEIVGDRLEFQISLRLLNAAVRYRETKGDKRVLLELPIEERKLLQEVLGIKEW